MTAVGHLQPWCSLAVDGSLPPDSRRTRRMLLTAESRAITGREQPQQFIGNVAGVCYLLSASGLVTSRACSMKSWARGLSVRFLSVMIPIGRCVVGSSTGSTFSDGCLAGNRRMLEGTTARSRPVVASLIRILMGSA